MCSLWCDINSSFTLPDFYCIFFPLHSINPVNICSFLFSLHFLLLALLFICLLCLSSPWLSAAPLLVLLSLERVHQPRRLVQMHVLSLNCTTMQKRKINQSFSVFFSSFIYFLKWKWKKKTSVQQHPVYVPQPRNPSAARAGSAEKWRSSKNPFLGQNECPL